MDTKNNLSLLKAKPPIVLVTSAEIRDATAQQSAAHQRRVPLQPRTPVQRRLQEPVAPLLIHKAVLCQQNLLVSCRPVSRLVPRNLQPKMAKKSGECSARA